MPLFSLKEKETHQEKQMATEFPSRNITPKWLLTRAFAKCNLQTQRRVSYLGSLNFPLLGKGLTKLKAMEKKKQPFTILQGSSAPGRALFESHTQI